MKRKIGLFLIVSLCVYTIFTGCQDTTETSEQANTNEESPVETELAVEEISTEDPETEEETLSMNITIGNQVYEVILDDNETTRDIVKHMSMDLSMVRYAGHEYYSELPFTPVFDQNRTSEIKAGHVYYWDGWNAFVINYEDYDISPYQVVHIGEIKDAGIRELLTSADDTITITVTE